MKRLILSIFFVLVLVGPANAVDVTLAWNANTESDLAGYRIYGGNDSRDNGGHTKTPTYRIGDIPAGTETYIHINVPDGIHYYSATAYDTSDNESDFSEEVWTVTPEFPSPKKEGSPTVSDIN